MITSPIIGSAFLTGQSTTANARRDEAMALYERKRIELLAARASAPTTGQRWEDLAPSAKAAIRKTDPGRFTALMLDYEQRTGNKVSHIYKPARRAPQAAAAGAKTWNGKTYAELKPLERATLKRENRALFDAMRGTHG